MTGCASRLMLLYLEVGKLHIVFSIVRSQIKEKFLSFLTVSVVIGDLSALQRALQRNKNRFSASALSLCEMRGMALESVS